MTVQPHNQDLYMASCLHYEKGHIKEAIEGFSLLVLIAAEQANHWFGLAASWQVKGDYEKSLKAWSITALLDPENPLPHFHAAECLLSQNKKNEALKALRAAENRHPPRDLQEKIQLLKTQNHLDEAPHV
jgi:tetratricopeptide (TPR) repeat protein